MLKYILKTFQQKNVTAVLRNSSRRAVLNQKEPIQRFDSLENGIIVASTRRARAQVSVNYKCTWGKHTRINIDVYKAALVMQK